MGSWHDWFFRKIIWIWRYRCPDSTFVELASKTQTCNKSCGKIAFPKNAITVAKSQKFQLRANSTMLLSASGEIDIDATAISIAIAKSAHCVGKTKLSKLTIRLNLFRRSHDCVVYRGKHGLSKIPCSTTPTPHSRSEAVPISLAVLKSHNGLRWTVATSETQ